MPAEMHSTELDNYSVSSQDKAKPTVHLPADKGKQDSRSDMQTRHG
jgi:hypothetical protein